MEAGKTQSEENAARPTGSPTLPALSEANGSGVCARGVGTLGYYEVTNAFHCTDEVVTEVIIDGGAGNDCILGGDGNDVCLGDSGTDSSIRVKMKFNSSSNSVLGYHPLEWA